MDNLISLRKTVEKEIQNLKFPKDPGTLYQPIKYVLEGGGKRLRPVLLLSFIEALGGEYMKFMNQALALEVYHNFTLLHDDVMDNSSMRHGRPTVHCKWNLSTAILSGDAMLSLSSIYMLRNLDKELTHRVMTIFNETALKIDEGQQFDMDFENRDNVTLSEYEEMIMLKTGALFACAAALAVVLTSENHKAEFSVLFKNAAKMGYLLGVVFQLQDDLLDTYGDPAIFGKKIGGDILNDKKTWLSINLLQSSQSSAAKKLMADATLEGDAKVKAVIALYDKLNLKEKLENEITRNLKCIVDLIEGMSQWFVEGGKELILDFVNSITGRAK